MSDHEKDSAAGASLGHMPSTEDMIKQRKGLSRPLMYASVSFVVAEM